MYNRIHPSSQQCTDTLHYMTMINISMHCIKCNLSTVLESNHYFVLLYPVIISRVCRHVFHKPEVEADDDDDNGDDDDDDQVQAELQKAYNLAQAIFLAQKMRKYSSFKFATK